MLYFASYHPEKYSRVVLENSGRGDEYDCPFARAAIELTKLLCEILKVLKVNQSLEKLNDVCLILAGWGTPNRTRNIVSPHVL